MGTDYLARLRQPLSHSPQQGRCWIRILESCGEFGLHIFQSNVPAQEERVSLLGRHTHTLKIHQHQNTQQTVAAPSAHHVAADQPAVEPDQADQRVAGAAQEGQEAVRDSVLQEQGAGVAVGIETDLDNVLQIPNVFLNVSKGQTAPAAELAKAFGKDRALNDVILEILNKGELQVGEKERAAQLDRVRHEVLELVASRLVDPRTQARLHHEHDREGPRHAERPRPRQGGARRRGGRDRRSGRRRHGRDGRDGRAQAPAQHCRRPQQARVDGRCHNQERKVAGPGRHEGPRRPPAHPRGPGAHEAQDHLRRQTC